MEGIFLLGIGLGNTAGIEIYSNHGFPPVYILSMIVATMSFMKIIKVYFIFYLREVFHQKSTFYESLLNM